MPIQPLDLEQFEGKADNLYEAVVIVSKRSKQINDEIKIELNQRLAPVITKDTEDDTIMNHDKLNISLEFEARNKPTQQSINEWLDGEVEFRYKDED